MIITRTSILNTVINMILKFDTLLSECRFKSCPELFKSIVTFDIMDHSFVSVMGSYHSFEKLPFQILWNTIVISFHISGSSRSVFHLTLHQMEEIMTFLWGFDSVFDGTSLMCTDEEFLFMGSSLLNIR